MPIRECQAELRQQMTKKPLAEHIVDKFSAMILVQPEWDEALQVPHEASFSAGSVIALDKFVTLDKAKERNVSTMSSCQLP
jgi:hypothetical protein